MTAASSSLVASPASAHPNGVRDLEEDTTNGGMRTFNQTHMKQAFQFMNDLRRLVTDNHFN